MILRFIQPQAMRKQTVGRNPNEKGMIQMSLIDNN